jgi:hypothetical protein
MKHLSILLFGLSLLVACNQDTLVSPDFDSQMGVHNTSSMSGTPCPCPRQTVDEASMLAPCGSCPPDLGDPINVGELNQVYECLRKCPAYDCTLTDNTFISTSLGCDDLESILIAQTGSGPASAGFYTPAEQDAIIAYFEDIALQIAPNCPDIDQKMVLVDITFKPDCFLTNRVCPCYEFACCRSASEI